MNKINESIVLVGGGGGVYRVARYLKRIRPNITTVQTMFDSGGHSKKLRDERGMLPPGDVRQAILALADEDIEDTLRVLMSHRFSKHGSAIDDATVGNLLITALTEHYGDITHAINALCKLFRVQGKVLPVSLDHAHLSVILSDGEKITGEGLIDKRSIDDDRTITKAMLEPSAMMYAKAYEALVQADKIVFCPGDLFTSVIPNALVAGFRDAMQETRAKIVMVVNIMTKKAETNGFNSSDFARTLLSYLGVKKFHALLCNRCGFDQGILEKYSEEKAYPVAFDDDYQEYTEKMIVDYFTDQAGGIVRHNDKVASVIARL